MGLDPHSPHGEVGLTKAVDVSPKAAPRNSTETISMVSIPYRRIFTVVLLFAAFPLVVLQAQIRPVSLRSGSPWERMGLETAWVSHTAADGMESTISSVTPYLTGIHPRTIYDVRSADRSESFAPDVLDRWGIPWGNDGAKRQADILQRTWKEQGITGTVTARQVPRCLIYAQTSSGIIQAMDAETGAVLWSFAQGNPNQPAEGIGANEHFVVSVRGSTLYIVSLEDQKVLAEHWLPGVPAGPFALTEDHVFVPLHRGKMAIFELRKGSQRANTRPYYGRLLTRPIASPERIAWLTDRGLLYLMNSKTLGVEQRVEMRSQVAPGMGRHQEGILYIASDDGFIHAIQESTGQVLWQRMVGGYIRETPLIVQDQAFVVASDGRLISLHAKTGEIQWVLGGMDQIAGCSRDDIHCASIDGRLVSLRRTTGESVAATHIGPWRILFSNPISDRIYLTTEDGLLRCLRPANTPWPTYFVDPPKPPEMKTETPVEKPPTPPTSVAEEPAATPTTNEELTDEAPAAEAEQPDPFGGTTEPASDDNPFE